MQLLLFSIVSQTSVHLIPPIFLRKRSRRPRLRDTSSIGMTRGLSILVPVSDKGNEGGPVLTFVVRGEYCTFSLARSLAASPSSARSFSFSFLGSLDPFFPLCLFPFPPPIPSPPIAHRLTAASPRLASPHLAPLPSISLFLCSTVSMPPRIDTASQGSKQGRYIYESMPYDKVLVTILSEL